MQLMHMLSTMKFVLNFGIQKLLILGPCSSSLCYSSAYMYPIEPPIDKLKITFYFGQHKPPTWWSFPSKHNAFCPSTDCIILPCQSSERLIKWSLHGNWILPPTPLLPKHMKITNHQLLSMPPILACLTITNVNHLRMHCPPSRWLTYRFDP
jgi:hypothetical protein